MQTSHCHLQNLSRLRWTTLGSQAHTPQSVLKIYHTTLPTLWGNCFIACVDEAICQLAFFDNDQELARVKSQLHTNWQSASFYCDPTYVLSLLDAFTSEQRKLSPRLHLRGSRFQIKVWETLLDIPIGTRLSYQALAARTGNTHAYRAVASAVAKNNIAYLLPCHRIIRKSGDTGDYRWGSARKKTILHWESSFEQTPVNLSEQD